MSINATWVFGDRARVDFSSGGPVASLGPTMNTLEGCAAISDASGSLLFYTDGSTVRDSAGTQRASGLTGDSSSTQSAIIVPDPAGPNRYYVFTVDGEVGSGGPHHLDGIHLNTSTWANTPLGLPAPTGLSPTEKLTAIQHQNCRDYWVITIVQDGLNPTNQMGLFRVFLVTANGVALHSTTPIGKVIQDGGYLRANPEGDRLAIANGSNGRNYVVGFNKSTGAFDIPNIRIISTPAMIPGHAAYVYGAEFSPDGKFLYFSILGQTNTGPTGIGYVFQTDLTNNSSIPVQVLAHNNAGGRYALGALQLAIDERIYIAQDGEAALGVIPNPNASGLSCGATANAVTLPSGSTCYLGLPNLLPNPCRLDCSEIVGHLNMWLAEQCAKKAKQLRPCKGEAVNACSCKSKEVPGTRCHIVEKPDIHPCISISWGDGRCDCLETDDFEVLCLTVCNCYSNVTFRDFKIAYVYVRSDTGETVPLLPDGTLSVEAIPRGPFCFGDIGPCQDGKPSCVSRQFMLVTRGARGGSYQVSVGGICFDVAFHYDTETCFHLELCSDQAK